MRGRIDYTQTFTRGMMNDGDCWEFEDLNKKEIN